MKLHRLHMHAFGPFADDAEVDFDALGVDGLFLLHGQTGAGKTTVLDAVAFALFGRVPGARNDGRRLLSDHAGPGATPSVTLEATIGGRRFLLTRTPEHHRLKRRGGGLRKVSASGTLVWVDGSGPSLSRLADIGEVIGRILGMTAEQFFQVVLLPQGRFAQFLRASNDERETLLEKLFETDRFSDIEEWFRDHARDSRAELARRRHTVDRLAGQIAVVAGVDHPAESDLAWADGLLDDARAEVTAAEETLVASRAATENADRVAAQAERFAELRRRGAKAGAQLAELAAHQAVIADAAAMIAAARRAEPLRSVADDLDIAARASHLAADSRVAAEARLRATAIGADIMARLSWPQGVTDHVVVEEELDRARAESMRLEPLEKRAAGRDGLLAAIAVTERTRAEIGTRTRSTDQLLASAPVRRGELEARLAEAVSAASRLPALRTAAEVAESARAAHVRAERLDLEAQRASAQLAADRERHIAARERVVDLRERRIAGMAAELSTGLRDGEPCVVCGSPQHPAPATADGEHVGDDDESAARAEERTTETDRGAAERVLAAIETERALWRDRTGGRTRVEAIAEVERADAQLQRFTAVAGTESTLRAQIAAMDADTARLREQRMTLQAREAECRERAKHHAQSLSELDADMAAVTDGTETVADRRAALTDLCVLLGAVRDARARAVVADDRLGDVRTRLDSLLDDAQFESVDDARAALRSSSEIDRSAEQVRGAADIRAAAQSTIDDPEVRRAMEVEPTEPVRCAQIRDAAREAATAAATRHAAAVTTLCTLERLSAEHWSAHSILEPAEARDGQLQGLAELIAGRGQNSRRMSLRSYVLAARLEEVILAASVRLRQMSSGRYEFAHSDAVGSRGRRSGLGIEIRDEYTGAVRGANTLSGGETFYASLALALGLADVVSAQSGGRVLDTIFIDEGFGTLDPEALDLVMGVLDELRSGGRVVGVVSHVDEMRARIPAQLRVIRGEAGSRLQMIGTTGGGLGRRREVG